MSEVPYRIVGGRLLVDVRLTPRGGRDRLEGAGRLADGRTVFRARVTAAPEDGKANQALEHLMADELGVPRSQVSVILGRTARLKTVAVDGDVARLVETVARLAAAALLVLVFVLGTVPASAQFMVRGDICSDPAEFLRTRVVVERAGLPTSERSRLVRTLRAAQSLAREACPQRDGWLVRRAVGMLNAVNREVRRPPVDLPLFLRE